MIRTLMIPLGLLLLVGTALVHGWWTQRWRRMPGLEVAIERLEGVPDRVGKWQAAPVSLPPEFLAQAGAEGDRLQRWTAPGTSTSFQTLLLCGRPGPLSVHRPEHCYPGAGYDLRGARVRYQVRGPDGGTGAEFFTARFVKEDVTGSRTLRIFWSWHDGTSWRAPDYPRWAFAPLPYLYKLYVIREVQHRYETLDDDPSVLFLRQLLPHLSAALAAAEPAPPGPGPTGGVRPPVPAGPDPGPRTASWMRPRSLDPRIP